MGFRFCPQTEGYPHSLNTPFAHEFYDYLFLDLLSLNHSRSTRTPTTACQVTSPTCSPLWRPTLRIVWALCPIGSVLSALKMESVMKRERIFEIRMMGYYYILQVWKWFFLFGFLILGVSILDTTEL